MMRRIGKSLGIALFVLLGGCVWHHPHGMPPGQAKKFVHVHGPTCGHVILVPNAMPPGQAKKGGW